MLVMVALVAAACGSEEGAGPRGAPSAVVGRAPELTLAAGRALVATAAPGGSQSEGAVDLRSGSTNIEVRGPRPAHPFVAEPALVIDVVRGTVRIKPFGGVGVRDVGTMMYEVDIDPARVLAATPAGRRARLAELLPPGRFYADVFIDTQGRIRRVLLPADLTDPRPYGDSKVTNEEMTVDFYQFGGDE